MMAQNPAKLHSQVGSQRCFRPTTLPDLLEGKLPSANLLLRFLRVPWVRIKPNY